MKSAKNLLIILLSLIGVFFSTKPAFSQYLQPYGNLAWNAEGNLLSLTYANGEIAIIDAQTREIIATFQGDEPNTIARWHPLQGDILAIAVPENQIRILNIRTGATLLEGFEPERVLFDFKWSPDGAMLATSYTDGFTLRFGAGIDLWNANSGELLARDFVGGNGSFRFHWKPDGQQIGYDFAYNDPSVAGIVDITTEEIVVSIVGVETELDGIPTRTSVDFIGWNHDGSLFATTGSSWAFEIWDSTTYESINPLSISPRYPGTVSWHPSQNVIAFLSDDQTIEIYDVETAEILHTISSEDGSTLSNMAWSPDGIHIAYTSANENESTLVIDDLAEFIPAE